jgi:hypothetical protein
MRWILIISFFLGLIPQFRASVVNPDERYKDSYSSVVGFFGKDVSLNDCSDAKHSNLKVQFTRIHLVNHTSRGSHNYLLRDFVVAPFSKFSISTEKKSYFLSIFHRWKELHLYKLFNNYRI